MDLVGALIGVDPFAVHSCRYALADRAIGIRVRVGAGSGILSECVWSFEGRCYFVTSNRAIGMTSSLSSMTKRCSTS